MSQEQVYTVTQAREHFAEVITKAIYGGPVYIKRNKREKVAVVSADLLDLLTQIEALIDSEKAQKALKEYEAKGGVSLSQLKKELGM